MFKAHSFIYPFAWQAERCREKSPMCWFTFHLPTMHGTGLSWSQEPTTQSDSTMGQRPKDRSSQHCFSGSGRKLKSGVGAGNWTQQSWVHSCPFFTLLVLMFQKIERIKAAHGSASDPYKPTTDELHTGTWSCVIIANHASPLPD